jgi:hypothetical protein
MSIQVTLVLHCVAIVSNVQNRRRRVQLLRQQPVLKSCAQISRHDALGDIVQHEIWDRIGDGVVREDVSSQQWEVLPRCEHQSAKGLSHCLYAEQCDEAKRIDLEGGPGLGRPTQNCGCHVVVDLRKEAGFDQR